MKFQITKPSDYTGTQEMWQEFRIQRLEKNMGIKCQYIKDGWAYFNEPKAKSTNDYYMWWAGEEHSQQFTSLNAAIASAMHHNATELYKYDCNDDLIETYNI